MIEEFIEGKHYVIRNLCQFHTWETDILLFVELLNVIQEPPSTIMKRNLLYEGHLLRYT